MSVVAETQVDTSYELSQNRTSRSGRIFLTGTQALVRLLIAQRQWDRAHGLDTSGFVTGYRGSPLAGVDTELWRARAELQAHDVRFLPGVNEDLAATALLGTQQAGLDPERKVDGVFAMWYGKGPGVDRAGDALRHGNAAGTSRRGGVLLVVGDDHAATSSSIPNASDLSLMNWGVPIVSPASVDEYETFGLWGWALSRYSSTWVALKAISETVESGRSVDVPALPEFTLPRHEDDAPALEFRTDDFLTTAVEVRLAAKLRAVQAFAAVNSIDRLVVAAPDAQLGIVAVGKAFHDLMDACARAGIGAADLEAAGVRVYKPGLTYPLAPHRALAFCANLRHVLVIEEKASVVEQQLKELTFNRADRPTIVGKNDAQGQPLVTWLGQLNPALVADTLRRWLQPLQPALAMRLDASLFCRLPALANGADGLKRLPYFCSGCPHNSSTKVPEGSRALAGVGCHYMANWMDRKTSGIVQMGGEGVDWVGLAPFTKTPHVFQNMGEGTYFHSGYLAIRQAIAAQVNVTYKILFNDAVAMTGGQPVDGKISVAQICAQVIGEGAKEVAVVTDNPAQYEHIALPSGVPVHHRHDLNELQRRLRAVEGVTILVYDQTCAAEKRRRRKKGTYPDPAKRLFINAAVCEGCGDCGVQSNCLSIGPLETVRGRKRQIDQSSCNKDYACADGFCPSFVSVLGGKLRAGAAAPAGVSEAELQALAARLPLPPQPELTKPYAMVVAGVGGTGVITIGALIAMAAHLEGKGTSVLDFTALAQKGGSVVSHLRIAQRPEDLHAVRVQWQDASALIAADPVVGALPDVLGTVRPDRTQVVINTHLQTLAEFTRLPELSDPSAALLDKIRHAARDARVDTLDAYQLSKSLLGDSMGANMLLLGFAWQRGLVPVSLDALMRAIELNAVAVPNNRKAFSAGRLIASDPQWHERIARPKPEVVRLMMPRSLNAVVQEQAEWLTAYQGPAYAQRYTRFVGEVEAAERRVAPDAKRLRLTETVARVLGQLMAYKDEYEVARLYTRPEFTAQLREQFEGDYTLRVHLAPPLWSRRNASGELVKAEYGPWVLRAFGLLARMKFLRGSPFDPFGYTQERREERQLIREYRELVQGLLATLSRDNVARAVQIAALAEQVRGYGHVKERNLAAYRSSVAAALRAADPAPDESSRRAHAAEAA